MTSATADVPRKVRQLENDVTSIYEILNRIEGAQGEHGKQLERLDSGQNTLGAKLTRQGNRLDELAAGQEGHASELAKVQTTLQRHGNRLDEFAAGQDAHTATLAEHGATLAEHGATLAEHGATLAQHTAILTDHSTILTEHTVRLDKLATTQDEHGGKLDTILELLQTR
jgi:chromosome segregation ATPase